MRQVKGSGKELALLLINFGSTSKTLNSVGSEHSVTDARSPDRQPKKNWVKENTMK